VRDNRGVEQTLVPGMTIFQCEFEKTGGLVRLGIAVIAEKETDSEIHACQNINIVRSLHLRCRFT
jgi:hypothetical protein